MLSRFETKMLGQELKAIKNTMRTQIYYHDPIETRIKRYDDGSVAVATFGERIKLVAGEQLPVAYTQFRITMKTIPRNSLNKYGIVITNVETFSRKK